MSQPNYRRSSSSRRRAEASSHRTSYTSYHRPVWQLIVTDILLTGICLLVFAYFHHVRVPRNSDGPIGTSVRATETPAAPVEPMATPEQQSAETPAPTETHETPDAQPVETPVPTPSPTPLPADIGMWGEKFADHFAEKGVVINENDYYQSHDIEITLKRVTEPGLAYFVADVYIRNIDNFKTAFAEGKYANKRQHIASLSKDVNALVAISGDYYGIRNTSFVLRNGDLYRDKDAGWDVCVLYYDGVMETCSAKDFNLKDAMARGAYQIWQFGPELLHDGQAMETFNSDVPGLNPRSSVGYYEPGHYCFILVDGRQGDYSKGITLKDLSQMYADLGCKAAFNLDGGATAAMSYMGELISKPYNGGRNASDILYFAEVSDENNP